MSEKSKITFFTVVNLIIINGVILGYLNLKYPLVGHDYSLEIPSRLDDALHFRLNGLTIHWFTPSFGGGIPSFPNPNNGQFSLPTLLMIFLPPWRAVLITIIFHITLSFIICEYFLLRVLKLPWRASLLGTTFFISSGFVLEQIAAGHLGYITFLLFPTLLIVLLDRTLSIGLASSILGLVIAYLIYFGFGGYFVLIIFMLTLITTLPLIYLYRPLLLNQNKILFTLACGGTIALFLSVSKLSAVFAFMRFFPRTIADQYDPRLWVGLFGILLQLLGSMNLVPLFLLAGLKPDLLPYYMPMEQNHSFGLWEVDMSLSPVIFIILLIAVTKFLHEPKKYFPKLNGWNRRIASICFLLALWLNIEFIRAQGFIYPLLDRLPIFSSLHVNVRFVAALIFPVILIAVIFYTRWFNGVASTRLDSVFIVTNFFTLLCLGAYFVFRNDQVLRIYDVRVAQQIYEKIQLNQTPAISAIGLTPDNSAAMLSGISNLNLYEPIFGYHLENFHPQLEKASIWQLSGESYNMTDPTGYVYPELNHNQPFVRFQVKDKTIMELFAKHIQPAWQIPLYQRIFNWVSGLSFILTLGYTLVQSFAPRQRLFFSS